MAEIKDYAWLLAIIGGIFDILTFATPTYSFFGANIWMWGVYSSPSFMGYGGGVSFLTDPTILGVGLPMAILILIVGLLAIFLTYKVKKGDKDVEDVSMLWLMLGIVSIVAPIIYLSVMASTMYGVIPVGFGAVAPFIGGGLLIAAGAIIKYT